MVNIDIHGLQVRIPTLSATPGGYWQTRPLGTFTVTGVVGGTWEVSFKSSVVKGSPMTLAWTGDNSFRMVDGSVSLDIEPDLLPELLGQDPALRRVYLTPEGVVVPVAAARAAPWIEQPLLFVARWSGTSWSWMPLLKAHNLPPAELLPGLSLSAAWSQLEMEETLTSSGLSTSGVTFGVEMPDAFFSPQSPHSQAQPWRVPVGGKVTVPTGATSLSLRLAWLRWRPSAGTWRVELGEGTADPQSCPMLTRSFPAGHTALAGTIVLEPVPASALALSPGSSEDDAEHREGFVPAVPSVLWWRLGGESTLEGELDGEGWLAIRPGQADHRGSWGHSRILETRVADVGRWFEPVGSEVRLLMDASVGGQVSFGVGPDRRLTEALFSAVDPALQVLAPDAAHFGRPTSQPASSRPPRWDAPAEALVLETSRLVKHAPGESAPVVVDMEVEGRQLRLTLRGSLELWSRVRGVPLDAPGEWCANDSSAMAQPTAVRGLLPFALSEATLGPVAAEPVGDAPRPAGWRLVAARPELPGLSAAAAGAVLVGLREDQLGLELTSQGGWTLHARKRHAVALLDQYYRTVAPGTSDAPQAARGATEVIEASSSSADVSLDALMMLREDPAPKLAPAHEHHRLSGVADLPVELFGQTLEFGLRGERDADRGYHRWSLKGSLQLFGLGVRPIALTPSAPGWVLDLELGTGDQASGRIVLRLEETARRLVATVLEAHLRVPRPGSSGGRSTAFWHATSLKKLGAEIAFTHVELWYDSPATPTRAPLGGRLALGAAELAPTGGVDYVDRTVAGLTLREWMVGNGTQPRWELRLGAHVVEKAEVQQVGPRVLVVWAGNQAHAHAFPIRVGVGASADPSTIEVSALTRCYLELQRREDGSLEPLSGMIGWRAAQVFKLGLEGTGDPHPHVSLVFKPGNFPGERPRTFFELNGTWAFRHGTELSGVVFFDDHRLDVEAQGDGFSTERGLNGDSVLVETTWYVAGRSIRWFAHHPVLHRGGGLDLSVHLALENRHTLKSTGKALTRRRQLYRLEIDRRAPPLDALGGVSVQLEVRLGSAFVGTAPISPPRQPANQSRKPSDWLWALEVVDHREHGALTSGLGPQPQPQPMMAWVAGSTVELSTIFGEAAEKRPALASTLVRETNEPALGDRPQEEVRWLACPVVDRKPAGHRRSTGGRVWVVHAGRGLTVLLSTEARTSERELVSMARDAMLRSGWHREAVVEHEDETGTVHWRLVDSPLLNRSVSLRWFTSSLPHAPPVRSTRVLSAVATPGLGVADATVTPLTVGLTASGFQIGREKHSTAPAAAPRPKMAELVLSVSRDVPFAWDRKLAARDEAIGPSWRPRAGTYALAQSTVWAPQVPDGSADPDGASPRVEAVAFAPTGYRLDAAWPRPGELNDYQLEEWRRFDGDRFGSSGKVVCRVRTPRDGATGDPLRLEGSPPPESHPTSPLWRHRVSWARTQRSERYAVADAPVFLLRHGPAAAAAMPGAPVDIWLIADPPRFRALGPPHLGLQVRLKGAAETLPADLAVLLQVTTWSEGTAPDSSVYRPRLADLVAGLQYHRPILADDKMLWTRLELTIPAEATSATNPATLRLTPVALDAEPAEPLVVLAPGTVLGAVPAWARTHAAGADIRIDGRAASLDASAAMVGLFREDRLAAFGPEPAGRWVVEREDEAFLWRRRSTVSDWSMSKAPSYRLVQIDRRGRYSESSM